MVKSRLKGQNIKTINKKNIYKENKKVTDDQNFRLNF
jgi:uncharacterized ubiquitin-like protein YukD